MFQVFSGAKNQQMSVRTVCEAGRLVILEMLLQNSRME